MLLPALFLLAASIQPKEATVPSRQPQLAAAQGKVVMTFGSGPSIYFTSSADQGTTFGSPVKVADTGALALGRHRGPRIAIAKNAMVISAIAGDKVSTNAHAHGNPESGDLIAWRSTDQGKTWTRVGAINDVSGAAREGLHAMVADAKGNLFAAWLDLRSQGTKLYGARSTDGGATWSKNVEIYASPSGTICQCCAPSLAVSEDGKVWAMWRNVVDGNRDLYAAESKDGLTFAPAKKLGTGTWKLNACPMDGGGFAVNRDGAVTSAWRREGNIFLADGSRPEKQVGTGKDVAMAQTKKGTYVAWTKGTGIEVLAPGAATPRELATAGAFVSLLPFPDGSVLAAWESNGTIETKRLP